MYKIEEEVLGVWVARILCLPLFVLFSLWRVITGVYEADLKFFDLRHFWSEYWG
jgi:hypothetical protein